MIVSGHIKITIHPAFSRRTDRGIAAPAGHSQSIRRRPCGCHALVRRRVRDGARTRRDRFRRGGCDSHWRSI
jgi:hypothetical protein